ncbi:hypothetical protein NLG97_g7503 [Lecanicillium saksenae]|uniref:Uncharacterized protein n=1 Tax=Lecanicillium saksenae TaxID=468837 RepID=A0ACC1QLP2_9HYPO|nr:hypothetical protein NLG97_g7503 [Lecanicillium saksenae]
MTNQPSDTEERRDATEEEIKAFPHVADSISFNVWVALLASAAERFSFYAVTTPWQNYIQNGRDSIAWTLQSSGRVRTGYDFAGVGNRGSKSYCFDFYWRSIYHDESPIRRYPLLVKLAPKANVLPQAARVLKSTTKDGFRLDSAKPAYQREKYEKQVTWDETFVMEIKRGLRACRVMACFVSFHLCMNQIFNNLVSQAGQMRLGGVPNDTIQGLNSIACILLGPVLQQGLYPLVRKMGCDFGPITRITWAFIMMSTSMAFAAGLQKLIYSRGPCYDAPLKCLDSQNGSIPNDISVWAQTPVYLLLSVAEILGFTTLSEYSYSEAPESMRTLVQALGQLSSGIGSALGIAFSPLSKDPQILYLYIGLASTMITVALVFWYTFRSHDRAISTQSSLVEEGPALSKKKKKTAVFLGAGFKLVVRK